MTLQNKENMHQLWPLQSLEDVGLTRLLLALGGARSYYTLSRETQHRACEALFPHLTGHHSLVPKTQRTKLWRMNTGGKGSAGHGQDMVKPHSGWQNSFT